MEAFLNKFLVLDDCHESKTNLFIFQMEHVTEYNAAVTKLKMILDGEVPSPRWAPEKENSKYILKNFGSFLKEVLYFRFPLKIVHSH